jgi:hypothetical protein
MGAYYTCLTQVGVTALATTFTHNLGITPSYLVVRPILHQAAITATAPLIVCTVGTNIVTVASGPGTLTTFDLEVQQIHSIID